MGGRKRRGPVLIRDTKVRTEEDDPLLLLQRSAKGPISLWGKRLRLLYPSSLLRGGGGGGGRGGGGVGGCGGGGGGGGWAGEGLGGKGGGERSRGGKEGKHKGEKYRVTKIDLIRGVPLEQSGDK